MLIELCVKKYVIPKGLINGAYRNFKITHNLNKIFKTCESKLT